MFHITHWKAGSQWVRGVLTRLAHDRVIVAESDMSNVRDDCLVGGAVYTPVYMTSNWFHKQVTDRDDYRYVVVIRDLRDALVSWYFSIRYSHGVINDRVADDRARLEASSFEEGMLFAIEDRLPPFEDIQLSWLRRPEGSRLIVRYEDMIADERGEFEKIFEYAGLDERRRSRRAAVRAESFRKKTGRKRGTEQVRAHHRKGVAGDWRNHFSDRVKRAFKDRFGDALIETGYEAGHDW